MKTLRLALILIFCLAGLADSRELAVVESEVEDLPGTHEIKSAAPDPAYDNFTWTLPSTASSVRLSLPTDIDNFLFDEHGGIGGYGLCAGGHVEGLDHVWIEFVPGTPAQSMAPGTVTDITLNGVEPDQEYHIWIDYGDNLIGIHMEIMTPYVSIGDTVARGQEVGMGMSFDADQTSGEIGMVDRGRTDGNEAWGGGSYVSPFDYLRDADKQILVDAYKENVIQPYQDDGTQAWGFEPQQPYLTNKLRLHDDNEGKLTGVWYLPTNAWAHGYPNDIMTFVEADNPYYTGDIIKAQDSSGSRGDLWSVHGTCEVDYANGKIKIYAEYVSAYYGIFEIDETGSLATLRIEYQEDSYPTGFSANALTYTEREYWTQFYLDTTAGANGAVDTGDGWYDAGAEVTITAIPDAGYYFANWSGDVPAADQGDNPLLLTMDQTRTVTANFAALAAPAGVSASDGTYTNKVRVNWGSVSGASGYTVWRSVSNAAGSGTNIAKVSATSHDDTTATAGQVYYYWVKATNSLESSGFSSSDSGWRRSEPSTDHADGDMDGDGLLDIVVYHEETGYWYVQLSGSSYSLASQQFGATGYKPVPGDYDGDGKCDPAVYHETSGYWYVLLSGSDYSRVSQPFGATGYKPVPGDYDGDGKCDPAIYHETSGYWYVLLSGSSYSLASQQFGATGYKPVPGDYDGDEKCDPAIYHETSGYWYVLLSGSDYSLASQPFGESGYAPVPSDYDGDARADLAVYHAASGYWYVLLSGSSYSLASMQWGVADCEPVPGDYDGDGKSDPAVYQESTGYWSVWLSGIGTSAYLRFGGPGYVPAVGLESTLGN